MLRRPKALYVSVDPPNIDNALPGALTAAQFEVTRTDGLENTKFADYQLIVLNNWDLEKIAAPRKVDLENYVKQGGGLLVIGGERNVYDLKKKSEDALDRAAREVAAAAISKGHRGGADPRYKSYFYGRAEDRAGARAAATGLVSNLRPIDQVGVLIFDNSFRWVSAHPEGR